MLTQYQVILQQRNLMQLLGLTKVRLVSEMSVKTYLSKAENQLLVTKRTFSNNNHTIMEVQLVLPINHQEIMEQVHLILLNFSIKIFISKLLIQLLLGSSLSTHTQHLCRLLKLRHRLHSKLNNRLNSSQPKWLHKLLPSNHSLKLLKMIILNIHADLMCK